MKDWEECRQKLEEDIKQRERELEDAKQAIEALFDLSKEIAAQYPGLTSKMLQDVLKISDRKIIRKDDVDMLRRKYNL